jgi:hypothetical protein
MKFALWNFARLHPLPGAAIRAAGRIVMGDAEKALRDRIAENLDDIVPADRYEREGNVATQVWLLAAGSAGRERTGAAPLLNHLRIPYRVAGLGADVAGAAAVFVVGASWSEVRALRARIDRDTLIVCFLEDEAQVLQVDGIAAFGAASRLLPHRDGLRSELAAAVVRALRDQLRVPLVTGKLAPLVGLRIDDVEGEGVATWLAAMLAHGWRPNLGLFLDRFSRGDNAAGAVIAGHAHEGRCDVSPHAFDPATFLLYDYPWGRPYSRDAFAQRWHRAKACFGLYGIPLSSVINAHFHVLSRSAAEIMAGEGAEYFYSELVIDGANCVPGGDNWPSGKPTECTSRMDASGIMQLSSGDHILDVMNARSHYDFMMHGGATDPAEAARRIERRLTLSLDCGFPAYATTHEYLFQPWQGAASHEALWSEVDRALADTGWGAVRKTLLAEVGTAAKSAAATTILSVASPEPGMVEVALRGGGADTLTVIGGGSARSVAVPPGSGERTIRVPIHS